VRLVGEARRQRQLDLTAPVQAQLEAYNRRDLEAFLACYAPDCRMEDGAGAVMAADREAMRPSYAALFANSPDLHLDVPTRIVAGSYVIDEEHGTGARLPGFSEEVHGAVVYRVADGLIRHVRVLM
jgi:hypothetical protein